MAIRLISVAVAMFCTFICLYEYEYVLTDKLGDQLIYTTGFIYGLLPFFKERNWRSPTALCTLISAPCTKANSSLNSILLIKIHSIPHLYHEAELHLSNCTLNTNKTTSNIKDI